MRDTARAVAGVVAMHPYQQYMRLSYRDMEEYVRGTQSNRLQSLKRIFVGMDISSPVPSSLQQYK